MPQDLQQKAQGDLSIQARALGSFSTGVMQGLLSWPGDKYKNLLMEKISRVDKEGKTIPYNPSSLKIKILENTIGLQYARLSPLNQLRACYRGFPCYGFYKTTNGLLRYGFQKPADKFVLSTPLFQQINDHVGAANTEKLSSFVTGAAIGASESIFLPIDRAKLLCQVNGLRIREVILSLWQEGITKQYAALSDTIGRNSIGSGSLFLTKTAINQLMGVEDASRPTLLQSFVSSLGGNFVMIVASNPCDITKVQKQMNPNISGGMFFRMRSLVQEQGLSALYKGVTAKLINSGLKGTVAMWLCEWWIVQLNNYLTQEKPLCAAASTMVKL